MATPDSQEVPSVAGGNDRQAVRQDEPPFAFSRNKWMKLFSKGDFEALSLEFLRCIHHFVTINYTGLSAGRLATVNDFVESFLFFFCHPDFKLPGHRVQDFLGLHPIICNIVAMSDFNTTTPWVFRLMLGKENFIKLLVLYNVRARAPIDPKLIFDANPLAGSQWWSYYWYPVLSYCSRELNERIREHIKAFDDRFLIFGKESRGSFFPITYVAPDLEEFAKGRLNNLVAKAFENVHIRNKPNRRKIAIATNKWFRSAVYTSLSPLIKALKGRYDFTLIHYGMDVKDLFDPDLFERIVRIELDNDQMNLDALQDNEFCALIYPDIGMVAESVYLCNIRIAPVQICMYGHPSSSWSAQVDYFIGGRKVERLDLAEKHYSERLVVIPGMGVYPVIPEVFTVPEPRPQEGPILVNCGWTAQKVTYPLITAVQEIIRKVKKKTVFRIFCGGIVRGNNFIPFFKDINALLGSENVQVIPELGQIEYLSKLCEGSFSIDAYPFGGFNTVIDALHCKKPFVAWEGDRAFARFGSATLEMIGMPELIARSREEYVEIVVRMVNDDGFRAEMQERVNKVDLKDAFAKCENPENFRKAIDYLVDNHDRLKAEGSRKPIVIE